MDTGMALGRIFSSLAAAGYPVKFRAFSAIDRYLGLPDLPFLWLETNADISALARLIDNLRFPGVEVADAAVDTPEATCYFRCVERHEKGGYTYPLLSFSYDWQGRCFEDPLGIYTALKNIRKKRSRLSDENGVYPQLCQGPDPWFNNDAGDAGLAMLSGGRNRVIMDGALLIARYGVYPVLAHDGSALENYPAEPLPGPELQRVFLNCLLVSPRPDAALGFLKSTGFLNELWPELSSFDDVEHSKEFHPEGNVWNHTLETFRHRKAGHGGAFDLRLSLGLLLHDAGKPVAASFGRHRFDGHAELGARAAKRFLRRLDYEEPVINDIFFLVKNHMLPAALKRLPIVKTKEIMNSPLFPTLMELYRCDESSSFKGLDGYHENSAAYQAYLKNLKNPYRSADGKKVKIKQTYPR